MPTIASIRRVRDLKINPQRVAQGLEPLRDLTQNERLLRDAGLPTRLPPTISGDRPRFAPDFQPRQEIIAEEEGHLPNGFGGFGGINGATFPQQANPFTVSADVPIFGTNIPITIDTGGGGGSNPQVPGFVPSSGRIPCLPGFKRDPITGNCRLDIDPGPGTGLPGSGAAAGTGMNRPTAISRTVLVCPTFANGKTGILWMDARSGDVFCLPRGVSGKGFGLIRKNKPRAKPFISAAQKRLLTRKDGLAKKAKEFARLTGQTCKKR